MAILAYFLVSVTLVVAGLSISAQPADAQSSVPSAGLASMRARLIGPNGALLVAPRSDTELHAGALSAADMPELLALARECTVLPARTEITLNASLGDAPVKVKVERDKGGRLEVRSPQGVGLNNNHGAVRAERNGRADSQAVALFGRIAGDFVTGASSSAMSLVLRREGPALRGTVTGSRNVPITIEFVKDGP